MQLPRLRIGALLLVVTTLGCGSGSPSSGEDGADAAAGPGSGPTSGAGAGSSGPSGGTGAGGSNNPVGDTVQLTIEAFDVAPGKERQVCKIVNLPVDVPLDAVRLHSTMQGTSHHFNAYKLLDDTATTPVSGSDGEVHDCSPASEQLSGQAAYFFGAAIPDRTLETPPGVAFHLLPQQRIILEQHVINASGSTIQGGVTFELYSAAADHPVEHYADIIWFANWGFFLPANQETSDTEHCTVPYDVEVFGLSSHTHSLGTHFSIERWAGGAGDHLYDSTDWQHPLYAEQDPPLSIPKGEGLEWTCTWKNTTGKLVGPGKNFTDEMCITFAAAYPKDTIGGDPIQCNQMGF